MDGVQDAGGGVAMEGEGAVGGAGRSGGGAGRVLGRQRR